MASFILVSVACIFPADTSVAGSNFGVGEHEEKHEYLNAHVSAAQKAAAQLLEHVSEGSALLSEVAAQLAEQRASLVQAAGQAFAHISEQSALCATCAVNNMREAAARLSEQQAAFMLAAGQTSAKLAERQAQIKQSAAQAAAQLAQNLPESPAVLKAAASRLREQHQAVQLTASKAMAQLTEWQEKIKSAASHTAAQLVEGVAESQAALGEAASHAAERFSEPQVALRRAVEAVSVQLSERQTALAEAASAASAKLTRSAASGQETLRQAAEHAAALLYQHEMLLRQSSMLIVGLAEMQTTFSPSAGRIAAQLLELQNMLPEAGPDAARMQDGSCAPDDSMEVLDFPEQQQSHVAPDRKAFAYAWLLAIKESVEATGALLPVALILFGVVACCLISTILTIRHGGGEDAESLGYRSLLLRAACWFIHRLCLGWGLVLISDILEQAPFHVRKYDAMGWPTWNTLLPFSSQSIFFIPAAAILNTAVAQRSRARYSTPATRRFYASLSREVHASIVGCFVSDWFLFPTDLVFFAHHILGLGIIFGVWSMVLREARSLATQHQAREAEPSAAISFWWITGLSIATMEASSFFYCLYSLMSFGDVLHLSLFAVFTYSNVLSIMCVIAQHPWRSSMKAIWIASGHAKEAIEAAPSRVQLLPLPGWLSSKAEVSVSYMWKSFMVAAICLARQSQMWANVREQTSITSVAVVGTACVLLAGGCVWRLRDFEGQSSS
eukprot:TRINITY_DN225_c0_g3_i1.p1 TRINITY_DN225_c0_g3~~TRINITY_DN225_c0_g3_i1.p1  ORF type:complete len:769 (-),score=166.92 TRINITY_DN225_c0_g3_i1:7-2193(-)